MIAWAGLASAQSKEFLAHVTTKAKDTPGKVGLVAILEQEANIAAQHAGYAIADKKSASVKSHIPHVQNAIDPSIVKSGPGKGFGVLRAAREIMAEMTNAAKASDASEDLRMHSVHIITCAKNIAAWANEIEGKSAKLLLSFSDKEVLGGGQEVADLAKWIVNGRDADGDGKITWKDGEGGLAQMKQHLGFIK